jgi:hypothetical protein
VASAASATVDIVVRLAPLASGLFVVASVEDATGTPLFAHEAGGFHRRTVQPSVEPSFAEAVRKAGYGEALASVLR